MDQRWINDGSIMHQRQINNGWQWITHRSEYCSRNSNFLGQSERVSRRTSQWGSQHPSRQGFSNLKVSKESYQQTNREVFRAKYTVMVSKHHCGRTFITYLGGWEGCSPRRRGCGAQPRNFWWIFGKNILKDRILGNTEFQKTGGYVTGRPVRGRLVER